MNTQERKHAEYGEAHGQHALNSRRMESFVEQSQKYCASRPEQGRVCRVIGGRALKNQVVVVMAYQWHSCSVRELGEKEAAVGPETRILPKHLRADWRRYLGRDTAICRCCLQGREVATFKQVAKNNDSFPVFACGECFAEMVLEGEAGFDTGSEWIYPRKPLSVDEEGLLQTIIDSDGLDSVSWQVYADCLQDNEREEQWARDSDSVIVSRIRKKFGKKTKLRIADIKFKYTGDPYQVWLEVPVNPAISKAFLRVRLREYQEGAPTANEECTVYWTNRFWEVPTDVKRLVSRAAKAWIQSQSQWKTGKCFRVNTDSYDVDFSRLD